MKKEYKIFNNGTTLENIKQCLKEGYSVQSYQELYKDKDKSEIKDYAFYTSTLLYKGKITKATKEQLQNIEKIYEDNGRLLWVWFLVDRSAFFGFRFLDGDFNRVRGVRFVRNLKKVKK